MSRQFFDDLLNNPATRQGRYFMLLINFLIFLSMVSFSVATLPELSQQTIQLLTYVEILIVVIFSVEYAARLYFAVGKIQFVFSFFGIIDLLSFAPLYFFLITGVDTRSLQVLRLFRLMRLFKLFRYSKAIERLKIAKNHCKDEMILFTAVAFILLFISAVGIYHFEKEAQPEVFRSVFDGLWWGVITLTTVGYGDIVPITAGGRAFALVIVMVGLGIVAVPTGLIASGLQQARLQQKEASDSNAKNSD